MTPSEKLEEIERAWCDVKSFTRFHRPGTEGERVHNVAVRALTLARELREGAVETSILRCTGPCGNTGWSSVICDCGTMETEAVPAILITGDADEE